MQRGRVRGNLFTKAVGIIIHDFDQGRISGTLCRELDCKYPPANIPRRQNRAVIKVMFCSHNLKLSTTHLVKILDPDR